MSGNKVVLRTQAKNGPEILKINTIIMQQQVDCKSFQKPENIFRKMQKKREREKNVTIDKLSAMEAGRRCQQRKRKRAKT